MGFEARGSPSGSLQVSRCCADYSDISFPILFPFHNFIPKFTPAKGDGILELGGPGATNLAKGSKARTSPTSECQGQGRPQGKGFGQGEGQS